jgi:hypothetical protein
MPYIGSDPSNRFVASKAASVYSGNGSTTAFTLEHAVGSDEDILVSVDGVIQEPSVAYAVSSGTTLTFTAAPSSNSGNNIFVYYLFRTVGTVSHPSNNALEATSGTFTGDTTVSGSLGIGTTNPLSKLTIGGNANTTAKPTVSVVDTTDGGTMALRGQSPKLAFDVTSSGVPKILMDNAGAEFKSGTLDAEGDVHLKIDANGHITKPKQSAFLAQPSSTQTNFPVNTTSTIVFGSERFDQNADFASNTFTAPVTGKYQLNVEIFVQAINNGYEFLEVHLVTSNRTYRHSSTPDHFMDTDSSLHMGLSVLADMDAADTAYVQLNVPNTGSAQTDVHTYSSFSGYLVA